MKIVGIDPSLKNFGYAVCDLNIDGSKLLVTNPVLHHVATDKTKLKTQRVNSDDLRRATEQQRAMGRIVEGCHFAFIEAPVGSQSSRAMASYGIVIGVLASLKMPYVLVLPSEVKMAGAGHKTASKEEMIAWAVKEIPDANWPKLRGRIVSGKAEHIADAYAAIQAGIKTQEFASALAILKMVA
jgi:Holliday junction resolvasome RuvABC endonuclease subunit